MTCFRFGKRNPPSGLFTLAVCIRIKVRNGNKCCLTVLLSIAVYQSIIATADCYRLVEPLSRILELRVRGNQGTKENVVKINRRRLEESRNLLNCSKRLSQRLNDDCGVYYAPHGELMIMKRTGRRERRRNRLLLLYVPQRRMP